MNLPPDFEVPDGFRLELSRSERRGKIIGRIWLEVRCLCDRSYRQSELVLFHEYWKEYELESVAARLAMRELRLAHGREMAFWAATLSFLPDRNPRLRGQIYQLHAQFEKSRDNYRAKIGLPPRKAEDNGPKPT